MGDREWNVGWEMDLSAEAREWVECRRRRYMPSYSGLYAEGYRVVAQLSPKSGKLVTAGKRVGMIQELEANDIIHSLEEMDRVGGRRNKYDFITGCVEPVRSDGKVNKRSDIRAYRHGISILAREMSRQEIAADEVLGQIMGYLKDPVEATGSLPRARRGVPVPAVYASSF